MECLAPMDVNSIIGYVSLLFVLIGSSLLIGAIYHTRRVNVALSWFDLNWRLVLHLLLFFLAGYLLCVLLLINQPPSLFVFVMATILLIGGLVIYVVTRISNKNAMRMKKAADLEHENIEIKLMQQRLESILDNAAESIITFDEEGKIESFNHAAEMLFGYQEDDILTQYLSLIVSGIPKDFYYKIFDYIGEDLELIGISNEGKHFPIAMKVSIAELNSQQLFTAIIDDISEQKETIERLQNLAEKDGLTGLYNRRYFMQKLDDALEQVKRASIKYALIYLDLDHFKSINDKYGHAGGDRLLTEAAKVLKQGRRKSDYVSRLGGDEFAILLYNAGRSTVTKVAEDIRHAFEHKTFKQDEHNISTSCSLGVYTLDEKTLSAQEALASADLACYLAKQSGRNKVHLFTAKDRNKKLQDMSEGWIRRLQEAFDKDNYVLTRMPIMNAKSRDVVFYEARVSLQDKELLAPGVFLPIAERFEMIDLIDRWVISEVVKRLSDYKQRNIEIKYFVHLSTQTLLLPSIYDFIRQQIVNANIAANLLVFEIREAAAVADIMSTQKAFSRLHDIGCQTAIDDFGTSVSSFSYLNNLKVDYIKIAGRYTREVSKSKRGQAIVKAISDLVAAFDIRSMAKLVENEKSLEMLADLNVDYVQGYQVGRPEQDKN